MSWPGTLSSQPKILIVRLGAMGDVIHTIPAVALLRRRLPGAEIHWAIEPHWAPLIAAPGLVDRVVELPLRAWRKRPLRAFSSGDLRAAASALRAERYELAIDTQGSIKAALTGWWAKPRRLVGFGRAQMREPIAGWLYNQAIAVDRPHVVERYLGLVAQATGVEAGKREANECPLPEGEVRADLPAGAFLLASPLAGWRSKQWPPEHYAALAALSWSARRMPLVLDCAPNDVEYVEAILRQAPPGSARIHASTLPQLIGATRRATAVVGVDSGPLHLAAALNRPGVAVFGPTDPARNGPWGETLEVLRDPQCEITYKRDNEFSPSMRAVSAASVWQALQRPLAASSGEA